MFQVLLNIHKSVISPRIPVLGSDSAVFKSLLLLVLTANLASCASPPTSAPSPVPASPLVDETLGELLKRQGYRALELGRMSTGHLLLEVSINGETPERFICDTGAGGTFVLPELAERLGLIEERSRETGGGVGGGGMEIRSTTVERVVIGEVEFSDREFLVMDFSHVNQQFEAVGEARVEGIIGADWLDRHQAVLDLGSRRLYVRPGGS